MSRRTTTDVRQTTRILRFFSLLNAGVSFASKREYRRTPNAVRRYGWIIAALGCAHVGGCVVTSAAEFPEEIPVPPVVLNTGDLAAGDIIAYDLRGGGDLPLRVTVKDDNVDDELVMRAKLSVSGQAMFEFVCPSLTIKPSQEPQREQFNLVIPRAMIKPGACTRVEIFVSKRFVVECPPTSEDAEIFAQLFARPSDKGDVASAQYWIWELSGDPASMGNAAQALVTSCQTVTRSSAAPMPMTTAP
jgi:hypothetical protein